MTALSTVRMTRGARSSRGVSGSPTCLRTCRGDLRKLARAVYQLIDVAVGSLGQQVGLPGAAEVNGVKFHCQVGGPLGLPHDE
jgi:hypothetical protein